MAGKTTDSAPFFVIEGNDGVGKTTQLDLLQKRLEADGHQTARIKFPRYADSGGYFAKRYLAGDYGRLESIGPRLASILFSVDRFDFKLELEAAAESGRVVLADRYVASNLAHQGSKIDDPGRRREFFDWVVEFEYRLLEIPRPDLNLILLVTPEVSRGLRASRSLLQLDDDIHATDDHQLRSWRVYREICQLFPGEFVPIDCQDDDRLKSPEEISRLVYGQVSARLPARAGAKPGAGER